MSSILLGTLGLTIAAIGALLLTFSRPGVALSDIPRIRVIAGLGLLFQMVHFGEEYFHQFYILAPELIGLEPWPERFFVMFNSAWLVIWALSILYIAKAPRAALFPIWFLAIASAANAIIHPLMSVSVGGYFPGVWSSPLVGIAGVALLIALASATDTRGEAL